MLSFKQKGRVVLINARVGKAVDVDDVIGMLGKETSNASGNRLMLFLNEVELVICSDKLSLNLVVLPTLKSDQMP